MDNVPSDTELKRLLQLPDPPAALAEQLLADLQRQPEQPPARRHWLAASTAALAASLLLLVFFSSLGNSAPLVIRTAYQQVLEDLADHGIHDSNYRRWLIQQGLRLPPPELRLTLAEHCRLGALPAKYLRFDTPAQGRLNLFVHAGKDDIGLVPHSRGAIENLYWFTLRPRPGLWLILLYEQADAQPWLRDQIDQMTRLITKEQRHEKS